MDLYLLHQPYKDVIGAWRALEEAKEEGKIRSIGIIKQTPDIMKKFLPDMHILPAVNQVELNPLYQQKELRAFMKECGTNYPEMAYAGGYRSAAESDNKSAYRRESCG